MKNINRLSWKCKYVEFCRREISKNRMIPLSPFCTPSIAKETGKLKCTGDNAQEADIKVWLKRLTHIENSQFLVTLPCVWHKDCITGFYGWWWAHFIRRCNEKPCTLITNCDKSITAFQLSARLVAEICVTISNPLGEVGTWDDSRRERN